MRAELAPCGDNEQSSIPGRDVVETLGVGCAELCNVSKTNAANPTEIVSRASQIRAPECCAALFDVSVTIAFPARPTATR